MEKDQASINLDFTEVTADGQITGKISEIHDAVKGFELKVGGYLNGKDGNNRCLMEVLSFDPETQTVVMALHLDQYRVKTTAPVQHRWAWQTNNNLLDS